MIIACEGLDACGKGTHVKRLGEKLNARTWKFPNVETQIGRLLYEHLAGRWWAQKSADVEAMADKRADYVGLDALVFQAMQIMNRMEVLGEILEVATKQDVVFDRYWQSGYAYGGADGLDSEWLKRCHASLPQPDLNLLLDIDLTQSLERRPDRRDRYEKHAEILHHVIGNYRRLWIEERAKCPKRWVIVDARGSIDDTAVQIDAAIAKLRVT